MPGRALDQSAMRERFSHLRRKLTIFETQPIVLFAYIYIAVFCVSKIVSFRLRGEKRSLIADWSRALPGILRFLLAHQCNFELVRHSTNRLIY